jgi:hypothetical protein
LSDNGKQDFNHTSNCIHRVKSAIIMKKLVFPFVILSFFACNGKQITQAKPNKNKSITVAIPQPTAVKDSIPANRLNNETLFKVEGSY